jgi:hypothetical protein
VIINDADGFVDESLNCLAAALHVRKAGYILFYLNFLTPLRCGDLNPSVVHPNDIEQKFTLDMENLTLTNLNPSKDTSIEGSQENLPCSTVFIVDPNKHRWLIHSAFEYITNPDHKNLQFNLTKNQKRVASKPLERFVQSWGAHDPFFKPGDGRSLSACFPGKRSFRTNTGIAPRRFIQYVA